MPDLRHAPKAPEPADALAPDEPLFRPQVLAERQAQWLGTVLITPRRSHRLYTGFALASIAGLLALLFFGSYVKKARVGGWLVPDQGMVRVYVAQNGVAAKLFIKDGDEVKTGQPLLALSTESQSTRAGNTQANIVREIAARRASLTEEMRQNTQLFKQQSAALAERIAKLVEEQAQIEKESALQETRVQLAKMTEQRQRDLIARGFISPQQGQVASDNALEQESKLQSLKRTRTSLQRERLALEGELNDLPLKSQAQSASIERNIALLGQDLAEAEARRELVVPAPQNGTITAIQVEPGGRVDSEVPVLSIVPAGSKLEAHLYTSTRAIGFVRNGQRVLLRYQAYSYQKFGHYSGTVTNVSRSAISPREMPKQLEGLSSLFGVGEPVYRITVGLDRQTVTAYGQPVPLQPGMQLEADLMIERRKLIEWVLDPLYTFTGRWNG